MPDSTQLSVCHINLARGFRGGERQTLLLVQALAPFVRQTLVVRKGSGLSARASAVSGVAVKEISKPFLLKTGYLKKFSVIHAHEAKAGHLALAARLLFSVPYVLTRRVAKLPKHRWISKFVYSFAAHVAALSDPVKSVVNAMGDNLRCSVIPSSFSCPAVDDSEVIRLKRKYRGRFLVGHVGALENKDKGQIHIIHAAKELADSYPDMHFLFLGSGSDQAWFERESSGCSAIEFAGFKSNIGDYYQCFDLFLLPSLDEGLGSSILDAFYFKLPVIASNTGGIPDVVTHEQTGLLVSPGDEKGLKEAIVRLYRDRDLGKQLGVNGFNSLVRFDINTTRHAYLGLYEAACSES